MRPEIDNIVIRILSKRQLKELVLYSPQHITRLEKSGLFPKRVQLGPNRVGLASNSIGCPRSPLTDISPATETGWPGSKGLGHFSGIPEAVVNVASGNSY